MNRNNESFLIERGILMQNSYLVKVTAVTEVYGSGQKIVAAVLEYNVAVLAETISLSCFEIEGRIITDLVVSDVYRGSQRKQGHFVELILDSDDDDAATKVVSGNGRHSRLKICPASLEVSQIKVIKGENAAELPPFQKEKNTDTDNGIADCFAVYTFHDPKSDRELNYHIYFPPNMGNGQKLPLVLFMHDAGSCSDDAKAALAQGSGAVVWAREAEMGKRPCYVVAPHYPEVCANDEFQVTWHVETTIALIKSLVEKCAIDSMRIYGTGQSMGCMMLCEMLISYPDFFAGSLLVAGQWNPKRMERAKDASIWSIVSAGDKKAFPIMGECLANMEKAGGTLSIGHMDAKADMAVLNEQIRRQKKQGCNLNFTWFEGNSILPLNTPDHPGMHHICTWAKAYDIEALREWLFEQRR